MKITVTRTRMKGAAQMNVESHDSEFYRKQTIEMIQNVKRPDILIYIYKMTKYIVLEDED